MPKVNPIINKNFNSYNRLGSIHTNSNFNEALLNASNVSSQNILNELKLKFGVNVKVREAQKDYKSVANEALYCKNSVCAFDSTSVVISPNILIQMGTDPEKKKYVEDTIKDYFAQQPELDKALNAQGKRAMQGTIIFHSDGTWTEIGGCQRIPEKLAEMNEENGKNVKKEENLYFRSSANSEWVNISVPSDVLELNSLNVNNLYGDNGLYWSNLNTLNKLISYQLMSNMMNSTLLWPNYLSYSRYDMIRNSLLAYSLYNKEDLL